jgi:hypothetical protein
VSRQLRQGCSAEPDLQVGCRGRRNVRLLPVAEAEVDNSLMDARYIDPKIIRGPVVLAVEARWPEAGYRHRSEGATT